MTGFGVTFFGIGVTVIFFFFFFGSTILSLVSVVNYASGSVGNMADVTAEFIASYGDS